jgi:hypothetical protein
VTRIAQARTSPQPQRTAARPRFVVRAADAEAIGLSTLLHSSIQLCLGETRLSGVFIHAQSAIILNGRTSR